MAEEECIEWDELGKCVKWEKTADGRLVANFKACPYESKKKEALVDEFVARLRKGTTLKE